MNALKKKMNRLECKRESQSLRMEVLNSEYEKINHFVRMMHAKDDRIERDMRFAEEKIDTMVEYLCRQNSRD